MNQDTSQNVRWRTAARQPRHERAGWGSQRQVEAGELHRTELLTGGVVDAVMEEVSQALEVENSSEEQPRHLIESLNEQLSLLQTQCDNLRKLLNMT